jgi:hypothetical protein
MSLFNRAAVTCPVCDAVTEGDVVASVNADRRPDLRAAIIDGSFQAVPCVSCGATLRLPPNLTYLDVGSGLWLLGHPIAALADWRDLETLCEDVFAHGFGAAAPKPAQAIGRRLRPRMAFGWPAVREKLLCAALDIDDSTLELLKLEIIRSIPDPPFADDSELRLVGADDAEIALQWSSTITEAPLTGLRLPWAAYEAIAPDDPAWASLRAEFAGRSFVDIARLLVA